MLGGGHFQKKIDKQDRKKAAKKESRGDAKGRGGGPHATVQGSRPAPSSSSASHSTPADQGSLRNKSALKGPVTTYGARDSGNDVKNVPFANKFAEKAYKREQRIPKHQSSVDPTRGNLAKQAGASSAAQRRRVIRRKGGDDLLDHFREKLNASTFRLLNEQVYNSPNAIAGRLLRDEGTFRDYHTGYRQQLIQWPMNPNTLIIDALLGDRRGKFLANKPKSMPGHIPPSWVVVDMGCGDAQIAAELTPKGYTVHSYDFFAINERVTVADSTNTPLEDGSADVVVFSLSLMATDYYRSLFEAFRILKPNRLLKIVEVRSRIPFPRRFAELVEGIGFVLDYQDVAGDYFVAFDFIKNDNQEKPNTELVHAAGEVLIPSLYKKR